MEEMTERFNTMLAIFNDSPWESETSPKPLDRYHQIFELTWFLLNFVTKEHLTYVDLTRIPTLEEIKEETALSSEQKEKLIEDSRQSKKGMKFVELATESVIKVIGIRFRYWIDLPFS